MTAVEMIPVDRIRVINARVRNKAKFLEIVDNISKVGLKKPITVSRRGGDGGFDLVCGQGRLEAFIACGATEIPAIVIEVPVEERLLRSLIENLTRRTPSGTEMARNLILLKERGHRPSDIARLIGVSEGYVTQLIHLIENGEERLVAAVERGDIPITVAIEIASCGDGEYQRSLQAAYESGELRGQALHKVRRIIEDRRVQGKGRRNHGSGNPKQPSANDLVRTLQRETQRQELLVRKSRHCEQHLRFVTSALKNLMQSEAFVSVLQGEKLDMMPNYLHDMLGK
jgi:ParB family chromosome partitioning protein